MGENYNLSSLIGHYLLYESDPSGINLLVYPSRENEAVSFNLAIHPDFVDTHFQLKRVFKLRITHDQPQISPRVLSVGDMENGTVIWRAPMEGEEK